MKSRRLTAETGAAGMNPGINLADSVKEDIGKWMVRIFLIAATFSFAFLPTDAAAGLTVGGLISLLNFRDLKKSLERYFGAMLSDAGLPGGTGASGALVMRYYFKLTLLVVILAALIKNGNIHIPGLVAGLSLVPATMIVTTIILYVKGLEERF